MKKRHPLSQSILTVFFILCIFLVTPCYALDISIDVAPNVLNILSKSQVVTVHTDIAYNAVVGSSVFLNDVAIKSWKADDRGNFVAKFWSDEIKAIPGLKIGNYNTFTLTGFTVDNDAFIGIQDIMVMENGPVGKE